MTKILQCWFNHFGSLQLPGEIVNKPLTPIKIKINRVKKEKIDNISQYTNEYAIVDTVSLVHPHNVQLF